ncbi:Zinc finger NF-X1-type [Penicillium subrubescens]|uniref:Zinc finger NF-X1-type n=1 Tax=Penicillium subrubescens TaxID=1316194 RepID=UPI0025452A58|nr:Zinc finger NF-X1-type [Penicillium subrubescens]KAJ5883856.1 Zinc finger NF-X1-type [Penicillium subrubescens]
MQGPDAAPAAPAAPRSRHRRRGRGPATRDGQQQNGPTQPLNSQATAPVQQQQANSAADPGQQSTQQEQSRQRRPNKEGRGSGARRGRSNGARRGGQGQNPEQVDQISQPQSRGMRARGFAARLTRPDQESVDQSQEHAAEGDADASLRADAPDFVPGMPASSIQTPPTTSAKGKAKARPKPPPKPPKVTTKSIADDIATRIHEDIAHNLYECPICTSELGRRSKVWACELCWTVFHLSCIKKWSTNEGAAAAQNRQAQDGETSSAPKAWRCPGCNLSHEIFPSTYSCWCEKEVDPRPLPGLPPHSCGQTCSRPRKGCPHPCDATCHAGPCAPCTAMGPTQDCFCGRNSSTKRCQDTDYERGWSCGEICGDLLPCGEHFCPLPCHEGLCGACEVKIEGRCYCGKVETEMLCSSKDEEMDSTMVRDDGSEEEWTGCFSCNDICDRPFDCGLHSCKKPCHPQDSRPAHCPKSPDIVTRCPCGKTKMSDIPGFTPRTSCEDPIPNCMEPCGKMLACGHSCDQICHTGPCGTCMRRVPISCQCGRNSAMSICHQGNINPPQCFRQCKTTLHCGRHACTERCCPGEQKAIERQALRRKLKSHLRPTDEDIEAEHICTRICGRLLKCGRHTCPELCHKGACNTCREAIFEEVSCNCGRSILYPPQPCGTKPPACSFPCGRPKTCGHPQTAHNCHTDEENCPKCPFLTEKECLCGKRVMKNVPCWLTDARCGQVCGALLKCGSHYCKKDCHRPGECEDADRPCQQACGKTKTLCGHPCAEQCHAPYSCPEKTPCSSTLTVTCSCGRLRQERRCGAAKAVTSKGQLQQPERLPSLTPLTCDDECSRLERNRSLASALGVDIDKTTTVQAFTASNLPYSTETLDQYIKLASTVPLSTLQTYESSLHSLATDTTNRSFRFQPAKSTLRAYAHSLATDWGFVTESHDPEPHRHVFVLKPLAWTSPVFGMGSGTSIGIGGVSVRECVKLRERERTKERDAQRAAALEAKAARDAAKSQTGADGWAQVASRGKKSGADSSTASTRSTTPVQNLFQSRSIYSALAGGKMPDMSSQSSKKERLVLRSGVGASKALRTQSSAEVVDSWEEAEEKEEQAEQAEQEQGKTSVEVEAQPETAEAAVQAVDQPAETEMINNPAPDIADGDSEHV